MKQLTKSKTCEKQRNTKKTTTRTEQCSSIYSKNN